MASLHNRIEGVKGESIAVAFLKKNGFQILQQNFKCTVGEIDIIAKIYDPMAKENRIHFIEVKARGSAVKGFGREAVNNAKQNKIRAAASVWLKINKLLDKAFVAFSVLEIQGGEITFLPHSF